LDNLAEFGLPIPSNANGVQWLSGQIQSIVPITALFASDSLESTELNDLCQDLMVFLIVDYQIR